MCMYCNALQHVQELLILKKNAAQMVIEVTMTICVKLSINPTFSKFSYYKKKHTHILT